MSGAIYYPPADRKSQPGKGGVTMPTISKVVLHSTETATWPGYGGFFPTLTYHTDTHQWRQHLPLNLSATTLLDPGSTSVRENRDNVVQVELVGYCDPAQTKRGRLNVQQLDDRAVADLGAFLAFMAREWQVPLVSIPEDDWRAYPGSYGLKASQRLTGPEYDAFRGVLGHQHVSGNDHGDPGRLPIGRILAAAGAGAAPAPALPTVPKPAGSTPTKPVPDAQQVVVVPGGRVYTGFGVPGSWAAKKHTGEDWHTNSGAADLGKPVGAPVGGRVIHAGPGGWAPEYGIHVVIEDATRERTAVCHLQHATVRVGDYVMPGDVVGKLGTTGRSSGPHVHVERRHSPFGYWDFERPVYGGAAGFPGAAAFRLGATHPAVTLLGRRLVAHGYAGSHDGDGFDPGPRFTEHDRANVRAFQRAQGWTGSDADGYPGPTTWRLLMAPVRTSPVVARPPAPKPDPTPPPAEPPKPDPEPEVPTPPKPVPTPTKVTTSLRALTLNCRLPSLSDDKPDDADADIKVRLPKLAALVKSFEPSVVLLQECDAEDTLDPLLKAIGKAWQAAGMGKVWVGYDSTKWRLVPPPVLRNMVNGGEAARRCVIVELESVKTGGRLVIVATHLGVHMTDEAKVRIGQAEQILAGLKTYGVTGDTAVLVGGDLNDTPATDKPGVRRTFARGWLKLLDLRARLDDASMHGDSYDTHHGYGTRRERGRWLDDLLTGGSLRPIEGWVLRTDASAPANIRFATDHNAVAARLQFTHKRAT